jgi:vesicle-associated membrane protein 72
MPPTPSTVPYDNAKIKRVNDQLVDVRHVMQQNVELSLDRGLKLEDMELKADNLHKHAKNFEDGSHAVRRHFCRRAYLQIAGLMLLLLIVALIIYFTVR